MDKLTQSQIELQNRLRQRWPEVIRRALIYRCMFGDPVQVIMALLKDIECDGEEWRKIIEEPYG